MPRHVHAPAHEQPLQMRQLIEGIATNLREHNTAAWLQLRPWRRHSFVLLTAGSVYITLGLFYILADPIVDRVNPTYVLPLTVDMYGLIWVIVGVVAVLSARWPTWSDRWGYAALSWWSAMWGVLSGAAAIPVFGGPVNAVTGLLVWGLVTFLWWAISGLHNPDDVLPDG